MARMTSTKFGQNGLWVHLLVGAAAVHAGCAGEGEPVREDTRTLRIVVAEDSNEAGRFGLAGDEPVFIGLGVSEGDDWTTHVLQRGENEVQIAAGADHLLAASLLTFRPQSPDALLYAVAETTIDVPEDGSGPVEAILLFGSYSEVPLVNIYG
jgi:hypothetical protein